MPSAFGAALVLVLALAPALAAAQTLYKWVDAQGRVQYSDKPPKGFKGEVTRIQPDVHPDPLPAAPAAAARGGAAESPAEDLAARRRAVRERLAAAVARAQARVDAARKALAEAGGPEPEEQQVIQQRVARGGNPMPQPLANRDPTQGRLAGGGMHGMNANRANCREAVVGGRKTVICPTVVPGEAYFDRIRELEEAVRLAEEDLAAAQRAYRRGVD